MATKGSPVLRNPKSPVDSDFSGLVPIPEKDLEIVDAIGSGSFGTVYRAKWKGRSKMMVAVKFVTADRKKEFEAELNSLLNVNHPNIIKVYGASIAPPKFHMVMELCTSNLQSYIRKNTYEMSDVFRLITNGRVAAVIVGRAIFGQGTVLLDQQAMAYMHSKNIAHRDLKTANILLDFNSAIKVCDFGAARVVDASMLMTFTGTIGYMAPEMLREQKVSAKADVYSFGVVLWELLTKKAPFSSMQPLQIIWLVGAAGQRLPIPDDCPPLFQDVLQACWKDNAAERPSFAQILQDLRSGESTIVQQSERSQPRPLAAAQHDWQTVIDKTLSSYKDLDATIRSKMELLERREAELKQREEEIRKGESALATVQRKPVEKTVSSETRITAPPAEPESETDVADENVSATLRRIKSLPLIRKSRAAGTKMALGPSPLAAATLVGEQSSPQSPRSPLGSATVSVYTPYTPSDAGAPMSADSQITSPLKTPSNYEMDLASPEAVLALTGGDLDDDLQKTVTGPSPRAFTSAAPVPAKTVLEGPAEVDQAPAVNPGDDPAAPAANAAADSEATALGPSQSETEDGGQTDASKTSPPFAPSAASTAESSATTATEGVGSPQPAPVSDGSHVALAGDPLSESAAGRSRSGTMNSATESRSRANSAANEKGAASPALGARKANSGDENQSIAAVAAALMQA